MYKSANHGAARFLLGCSYQIHYMMFARNSSQSTPSLFSPPHIILSILSQAYSKHSIFLVMISGPLTTQTNRKIVHCNDPSPAPVPSELGELQMLGSALWLGLERPYSFMEQSDELTYSLLANGLSFEELGQGYNAFDKYHSLLWSASKPQLKCCSEHDPEVRHSAGNTKSSTPSSVAATCGSDKKNGHRAI
ncbi:hypothetical protein BDK51DRAFT_27180 [Blyttiomyces helicus]|uniref:Uncharacterized protein n=1 Tax=Blyttiomyces helicus TaxID=388810 RepID=A0A4V1IQY7_9FUNG|nr:hypothetical protein BDK51DRAFT_27180 [Blyttiomyces helicus]|eukprot:RKO88197.1 hypothetical protein BDK51DRAFT_27180 [Blyttiomyces helicus]